MKKIIFTILALLSLIHPISTTAQTFGEGNIGNLPQLVPTTTPYGSLLPAITQRVYGRPLFFTGLTPGKCVEIALNGLATTSANACGSGGGGGGAGNVATSSVETSGYIPYWTSTGATPATLGSDIDFRFDGDSINVNNTDVVSGSFDVLCFGTDPSAGFFSNPFCLRWNQATGRVYFDDGAGGSLGMSIGALSATTLSLTSPLTVVNGGTGVQSFPLNSLIGSGASTLIATGTGSGGLTVSFVNATSTTATSTFLATTTVSTLDATYFADATDMRWKTLNQLDAIRGFARFTQYNANVSTTTFHPPTNYYLATSTTNLSAITSTNNSGVTYNPTNNSLLFINNSNFIYEHDLDGKFLRTITLSNFTDTEALTWMYDDVFAIGDEQGGRITYNLRIPNGITALSRTAAGAVTISTSATFGTGNSTIEGIAYDIDRDVFYIGIEGTGSNPGVYTVTKAGVITATFSTSTWSAANIGDVSDLYFNRNDQHMFIAIDQCPGQGNGPTSQACDGFAEIDMRSGAVVDKIHAPVGFTQVEGIGFTPDGRLMFLDGEGDMFAKYIAQDRGTPLTFYQSASTTPVYLGIGTTTPYAPLSVVGFGGIVAERFTATSTTATTTIANDLQAGDYVSADGTYGFTGTCTILGLTSITVKNGLITSCQ